MQGNHHLTMSVGPAIDEPADSPGAEFMLPPLLEVRRAELLGRLETIDTGAAAR